MAKELKLQAACFQSFHNKYPQHRGKLFRVKNELDNHPYKKKEDIYKQLNENKATGVISGPSDFILVLRAVCFIELKVDNGRQSKPQEDFQAMATGYGHLYFLVWTLEEFDNLIISLLEKYS